MEQLLRERGSNLRTASYVLPPGALLCLSAHGAARLLNRSRVSVWTYIKQGRLRSFRTGGNVVVPLADLGTMLGRTETETYNIAVAHRLPIWQIFPD